MSSESTHRSFFSAPCLLQSASRPAAFAAALAALSFVACGSSDTNGTNGTPGTGGYAGGVSGTGGGSAGGNAATAGGAPASGGVTSGSGGIAMGAGGIVGQGGAMAAGGVSTATGGASPGTGGTSGNTGGTSGTGGGSGGTGGSSGAGGTGGASTGGAGGSATCMKGTVKASQVVMIGDSYIQIPGTLQGDIQTLARMSGAIGATDTYRNYAVSGTSLGNGQIPSQFTTAKTANPDIKVVIMDGGGNDVLLLNPACLSANPAANNASCVMTVANATMAAKTLAMTMADAGVEDLVYFFYPSVPAATGDILAYSQPLVESFCSTLVKPKCHFISTKEAFDGKQAQYIGPDGIHPTTTGAQVIAGLIWDKMKADCVAQ
jgi:hypothetical protein